MSHPDFVNRGSALGKFIEECGEALAAAGKTVRFGWATFNPLPGASKETNEAWLEREVRDLEEAIARLKKSRCWGKVESRKSGPVHCPDCGGTVQFCDNSWHKRPEGDAAADRFLKYHDEIYAKGWEAAKNNAIAVCDKYRDDTDYVVANSIKRDIEALEPPERSKQ